MSGERDQYLVDLIGRLVTGGPGDGRGALGETAHCVPLSELVDRADDLWNLPEAAQGHLRDCPVCQSRLRTAYETVDPSVGTLAASLREGFAGTPAVESVVARSPRLRAFRHLVGARRWARERIDRTLGGATAMLVPAPAHGFAAHDPGPVLDETRGGFAVTIERVAESHEIIVTVRTDRDVGAVDVLLGGEEGAPSEVTVTLEPTTAGFVGEGLLGTADEIAAHWTRRGDGEVGVVVIPVTRSG